MRNIRFICGRNGISHHDASQKFKIDVFFDKLEMSHTIDFKNRLEKDSPTIPLAELLLEKMQIVQINEKDIKDAIILILGHEIADDDNEHINGKYVASLLASDWGLYYTTLTNLDKVKSLSMKYDQLSETEKGIISSRIDSLIKQIDEQPKGSKWKLRARIGTKRKWYTDVEERFRPRMITSAPGTRQSSQKWASNSHTLHDTIRTCENRPERIERQEKSPRITTLFS